MKHKKTFLLLLCSLTFSMAISQKHSATYVEAGGAGLFGTLNYDFRFKETSGSRYGLPGLRIGIGVSPKYILDSGVINHVISTKGTAVLILVGINSLCDLSYAKIGGDNIELGVNLLYAQKNSIADKKGVFKQTNRLIPSLNLGYRFQSYEDKGFLWRLCYDPYLLDGKIHHWFGISAGYNFN